VFAEPGGSQYHDLVAKTGYSKLSAFRVNLGYRRNHVYHLTNGSCFIGRTIHIVHRNGACEGSGGELVLPYVVRSMNSPSAPQSRRAFRICLLSVSCHNLNLDVQEFAEGWKQLRTSVEAVFPKLQADWEKSEKSEKLGEVGEVERSELVHVLSSHFISQIC